MDQLFFRTGNRLLASLPPADLSLLEPQFRDIDLLSGDRLYAAGDPMDYVYFPQHGVVSLVVMMADAPVEVAMIGREGLVGGGTAFGVKRATTDAIVQVRGRASRLPAARFRQAAEQSEALRELIGRYEAVTSVQAQQSVACNALHPVEARVCRWLLEMRDRTDTDTLALTQEFLASMLGVQRTTVTAVARKLQVAGAVECRRGHIRILSREQIERMACDCYERVRQRTAQILPEGRPAGSLTRQPPIPQVVPPYRVPAPGPGAAN
jgi:CRP-like cAMP-binding protein